MLLRYQDKEERAPAALRLRGAGGECPQISGPRQRACRWLQWPPPGARECARGPLRANGPNKARYIIRAGPTGPGPLQGRVAQAPPRWGQRQAASGGGRAARQGLCARGRDRAPAAGQCKGGNAAAPTARLALHCCADCASGNPARRPTGRRRRWRGRGAQRAASKHYAGWRAGCAVRGPQAGVPFGSVGRLHVGTARRAVMVSTRPMVRPRASRRARCARWAGYQQQHRAAPTRPGWAGLAYSEQPSRL